MLHRPLMSTTLQTIGLPVMSASAVLNCTSYGGNTCTAFC